MNSLPRLLTIQDVSCVGQCSATVALPLISACGVFASVFAGAILRGLDGLAAAALAADIVCASIEATSEDHWYGVAFERTIPLLAKRGPLVAP